MIGILKNLSSEFLILQAKFVLHFTSTILFTAYLYCTFILQDFGVTLSTVVALRSFILATAFLPLLSLI